MSLQALRTPSKWRSFASLRPVPPGASKSQDTRDVDIHEDNHLNEAQLAAWVEQASRSPGERM